MKKRYEQSTPEPDSFRPDVPPDEGNASADDFAQRLAALLRADKHAQEEADAQASRAAAQPPIFPASDPDRADLDAALDAELAALLGDSSQSVDWDAEYAALPDPMPLSEELEAELAALLGTEPESAEPEPEPADAEPEPEPADAEPEPEPSEPEPVVPEPEASGEPEPLPARPKRRHLGPRSVEPARLQVRPSAQELREPLPEGLSPQDAGDASEEPPRVRADLSDAPFVPPEGDPSLEEIFQTAPEETDEPSSAPEPEAPQEAPEAIDAAEHPASAEAADHPEAPEPFPLPAMLAAEEAPPPPLSRDTTGTLPTLEELFGPGAEPPDPIPEEESAPFSADPAPERAPRRGKLWGLLDALLAPPEFDESEEEEAASPEAQPKPEAQPEPETVSAGESLSAAAPEAISAEPQAAPAAAHEPTAGQEPEIAPDTPPEKEPETDPQSIQDDLSQIFPSSDAPDEATAPASKPDAAPPAEPATIPMNLPKREAPAEASAPLPRKPKGGSGHGAAMTLEELLAAAVPIEEAAPPVIPPPQAAEPEKPASRRKRKRKPAPSRAGAAEAAAPAPKKRSNEETTPLDTSPAPRESPVPAPEADPAKPPKPETAPEIERQLPPQEAGKSPDPVPSADVRKPSPKPKPPESGSEPRQAAEPQPREVKEVLHPEEAYRQFARPLDLIGSRLILTGLFTILSLFFTLYLSQHWTFLPEIFSGGTTVYIQLGLLTLTLLINWKLFFRRPPNTRGLRPAVLLALAALFTAADCFQAATELRSPFTVVFGALTMVFLWGEYARGMAMTTTVKVLRAETLAAGVSEVPEIGKGGRGLIRTAPDVDRFMEKLETSDLTARFLRVYTPVAAAGAFALTLLISFGLNRDLAWTGSLIFLGSVPVAGLLAYPRLFLLVSRRLAEADAALCGYHGAEVFGREHSILIGDEDIFPAGSLTLNGFKVYNSNPDKIIAYAAAAARSSGSALDPVFDDLLVTHNGRHYIVDTFRFYDSGGIGASIGEDVVLMGSLDFMRRMGVHMDKGARVKQAVYLSLNGELAAVFAVRYAPPENLRKGLASIAANRHFKGILVTRTFLGTPSFLKAKFGIPAGTFLYPSTSERIRLSEAELKRTGAQGAILAKDSFSGFAQAAAAGRMLRSTTLGAAILTVLCGISGLLLMGVLAALSATETATALNLLLYFAAWMVPTLLLTVWGRHF